MGVNVYSKNLNVSGDMVSRDKVVTVSKNWPRLTGQSHRIALCTIAPRHDLFGSLYGDMIFMQAGWSAALQGTSLYHFQTARASRKLILDNQHPVDDTHVTGQADLTTLIVEAMRLEATDVIIPDVLNNSSATLSNLYEFSQKYPDAYRHFDLMFVPQGRNEGEWLSCLRAIQSIPFGQHIVTIGVPKWLGPLRWKVLSEIPSKYKVHFLGVRDGWGELEYHPRIRSWDTSLPYAASQLGLKLFASSKNWKPVLYEDRVADHLDMVANTDFCKDLLFEERVRDEP